MQVFPCAVRRAWRCARGWLQLRSAMPWQSRAWRHEHRVPPRACSLAQDSFLAQFGGSGKETAGAKATLARHPLRAPALEPWFRALCYVADIGPGQAHAIVHAHPSLGELMCHYADPARRVLSLGELPTPLTCCTSQLGCFTLAGLRAAWYTWSLDEGSHVGGCHAS